MQELLTDLLVVGGGGAALRAAIEAYESGVKVLIVQKGIGSTAYKVAETAGFNSPDGLVDQSDNPLEFKKDILEAALGTSDEKLVDILAQEAIETVEYLEHLGVPFEYDQDKYLEVIGCFANKPRMHIIKGHGEPIIKVLKEKAVQYGIKIHQNTMVTKLLTDDGKIVGAVCIDTNENQLYLVKCKAIFLGTGGAGQLFKFNHNPPDITGDGYVLALKAGASLVNMEFMQSGLGVIKPLKVNFNNWIWAGYPKILNKNGEEFLHKYLPVGITLEAVMDDKSLHYPFSSRDLSKYIEASIHKEILAGNGTDNGGVYVDFSPLLDIPLEEMPDHMAKLWPLTKAFWEENGVDLRKDKVEISTFGHAINGGIRMNEYGGSDIIGLYAAGETAGGPHGADRLGGNMLVTCQVFGARAGKDAASYIKDVVDESPILKNLAREEEIRLKSILEREGIENLKEIKKDLQELMWSNYLVVKNEGSLQNILDQLEQLLKRLNNSNIKNYYDLRKYLELENMIFLAKIITIAAKARKESRGSHYRDDYPIENNEYGQPIFVNYIDKDLKIGFSKFSNDL